MVQDSTVLSCTISLKIQFLSAIGAFMVNLPNKTPAIINVMRKHFTQEHTVYIYPFT